jgi:hypothetical protein
MRYLLSFLIYNICMEQFISFIKVCTIYCQRWTDHLWRRVTGLPLARRSLITPQLYVGGQYSKRSVDDLERLGVTGIVNMRMHSVHKDIKGLHMRICNLPTPDLHAPTQENLQKGIEFIKKEIAKGGKVYIHCRQGEGRGPTMAIAYLISTGLTYDDAFSLVQRVRTFIRPTRSQIETLRIFENSILKK